MEGKYWEEKNYEICCSVHWAAERILSSFVRLGNIHDMDFGPPPPIMKSFKEFLISLDDSVDETEAVKRYNEYKLDYRRQQMQDFFLAHKDEEWYGLNSLVFYCLNYHSW